MHIRDDACGVGVDFQNNIRSKYYSGAKFLRLFQMASVGYSRSLFVQPTYAANLRGNLFEQLDQGNKVILPPEVLAEVINLENQSERMVFRLLNENNGRQIYAGVLNFEAPTDQIILPFHLMQGLDADEGYIITIELVNLPKATAATVQANTYKFYQLSNPKSLLETELRNYVSLNVGQTIPISYLGDNYVLTVIRTEPADVVDILDTDIVLDFEDADDTPPISTQTPSPTSTPQSLISQMQSESLISAPSILKPPVQTAFFQGPGRVLGGSKMTGSSYAASSD